MLCDQLLNTVQPESPRTRRVDDAIHVVLQVITRDEKAWGAKKLHMRLLVDVIELEKVHRQDCGDAEANFIS
jgi:hypothetical protein